LLNALAVVALFFIVSKLIKQLTREIAAFSAMRKPLIFTAVFYRAGVAPNGLSICTQQPQFIFSL
jgi:hypothetical protein